MLGHLKRSYHWRVYSYMPKHEKVQNTGKNGAVKGGGEGGDLTVMSRAS